MNKLFYILTIALVLITLAYTISAHEIVWTQYSDTTSVDFVIENPAQPPEEQKPCKPTNNQIEKDREYEQSIIGTKTGNWVCINNQLQRTNTINGKQIVEYGGLCGIVDESKQKITPLNLLFLIPFTLFILILILSVLVVVALLRK